MKGYSRQSDYTRKTEKLSQERKILEDRNAQAQRLNEEAKIKRDEYAANIKLLEEQFLANESKVDMDKLYAEDPAEYVREEARQRKRKEMLQQTRDEKKKLQEEQMMENMKNRQIYLAQQSKLLAEKLPIYADPKQGPQFRKNLQEYA